MARPNPCAVCGEMTSKLLFKDKKLNIAICSVGCEYSYFETLSRKDENIILGYFDRRIERTKLQEKMGWAVAGLGLLLVAIGFFVKNVDMFITGLFPMTVGSFSTRHFQDRTNKLIRMRKRIAI